MFYILAAMIVQFIYNMIVSWRMDDKKAYKVVIDQSPAKVRPQDVIKVEDLQAGQTTDEKNANIKIGQIYEYQEGGKRNKQKRNRKQVEDTQSDKDKQIQLEKDSKEEQENDDFDEGRKREEPYTRQTIFMSVFHLHQLMSIFFFYDEEVKRYMRSLFYFFKITLLIFFSQYFQMVAAEAFWGNVVICLLIGQLIDQFIFILKTITRVKFLALKFISLNICAIVMGFLWYFIYKSKSWDWTRDSNQWGFIYLSIWSIDQFVIEPLLLALKVVLINFTIKKKKTIHLILRKMLIQYEENQWFRGMESILEVNQEKIKQQKEKKQEEQQQKLTQVQNKFDW
eukprot:TRINITY_DN30429_c0_g1_i1.p1 TRINITY_DN30429_c0_g1~~TRINITY_DN30429_c0_g1_i1.p1  ORF type:complete len:339 (-),score=45.14 TRINITY_DN30429_c0_g1_i1:162-1178(-)